LLGSVMGGSCFFFFEQDTYIKAMTSTFSKPAPQLLTRKAGIRWTECVGSLGSVEKVENSLKSATL
jgi:hypothetical protein